MEDKNKNEVKTVPTAPKQSFARANTGSADNTKNKKNFSKSARRESRTKAEFDQKIISIRRVARVVAGGRRFSFSVSLVAGNRKGGVGVGVGKATDTPLAIEKAFRDAKKNMVFVNLTPDSSIPYEVRGKLCASDVWLKPTGRRGVLAGSSVKDVIELAGIKNISAKIFSRSKNRLNNAKATVELLARFAKKS